MSIEFIEGFDHYTSTANMARKWGGVGSNVNLAQPGRYSGFSMYAQGNTNSYPNDAFILLSSLASRTIGMGVMLTAGSFSGASGPFLLLCDNYGVNGDNGIQCALIYSTSSGLIEVTNDTGVSNVIGTCSGLYLPNVWYYLEISVTISNSVGAITIKINNQTVLTLTNVDLQNSGNATFNNVMFNGLTLGIVYFDDIYIQNVANAFLGECRVMTGLPSGDSATNHAWTPNSGTAHFSRVNDADPNGDSSYNSSATAGAIDTYFFPAVSTSSVIAAVQHVLTARKDDAGSRVLVSECRSAGANYDGANNFAISSSYAMFRQIYPTDPATGAAWVPANLNAAEFGAKVIS